MSFLGDLGDMTISVAPTAIGAGAGFMIGGPMGAAVGAGLGSQASQYFRQKKLQKEVFSREDSAVQRRLNDLRAAGLSPTLAAGDGAGSGSVVSSNVPDASAAALNAMSIMQMNQNMAATKASTDLTVNQNLALEHQKHLVDMQAEKTKAETDLTKIKAANDARDLDIYRKWPDVPSTASALAKTVRDMPGFVQGAVDKIREKVKLPSGSDKISDEELKQRLKKLTPTSDIRVFPEKIK